MFRASDIFGRRPGEKKATVATKVPAQGQKRALGPSNIGSASSRTWDPATGKWVEEELPAEVQQMIGQHTKKVKVEQGPVKIEQTVRKTGPRALGPAAVGLKSVTGDNRAPSPQEVDTGAPSVEYSGFSKVDLNERYYEKRDTAIHGKPTFWTEDAQFFLYWQGEVNRWSLCDRSSFPAVKAGQYPGWAYKEDHKHFCTAGGWMEAWHGEWKESTVEVIFRSSSASPAQWEDPALQKSITTVEFDGFTMKELSTRYYIRTNDFIQGRPSFWDSAGVYFLYWQSPMKRWAICDRKCLDAVRDGQCPGWAYRRDMGCFANACGWMERQMDTWTDAAIETSVISVSSKGLKVEFHGFQKEELNCPYSEKPDVEIQGRSSFWDQSETYFIYWQSGPQRWAICDSISLGAAKSGLTPGWAYRTDSAHFARSRGWMEVDGADWKAATVTCTVLEGKVPYSHVNAAVKAELLHETGIAPDQYRALIEKIYEAKNPLKLQDLDQLMEKYQDKEHELYKMICDKYEVDGQELAKEAPPSEQPAVVRPVAESDAPQEEEPPPPAKEDDGELEHLTNTECPQLSAKEYAILTQLVYEKYMPAKLADLGRLLQKYRQNERELYIQVCDKYNVHPAKWHVKNQQETLQIKTETA
eukprot:TRINITY_DN2476_c0_g1_i7.p1 TRINITY_DN2476_c0_g1~~TRINITY_DN2476_c0_g1_i7.p1  ORF type:complete len:641 (-),score=126.12 TRINITY_DN2476_c0_g1_i7:80-2002(-)